MRILSSKSHISTNKLMRTNMCFKKNNPEPPGGPQGGLRRSLTHMHTPATAHQRSFSVIFALKTGFYAAKADFRCSKWPYKVILKPYGQISHTYTIQDIQTACLNLFLKRFEDFPKLKMRQIDQKWVTQSQTGPPCKNASALVHPRLHTSCFRDPVGMPNTRIFCSPCKMSVH